MDLANNIAVGIAAILAIYLIWQISRVVAVVHEESQQMLELLKKIEQNTRPGAHDLIEADDDLIEEP